MTDKVMVTQDQADAIDDLLNDSLLWDADQILERHTNGSMWFERNNRCLNGLSVPEMAKALYVGYEVEPEYKEKDWITVFHENGTWKCTARITSIDNEYLTVDVPNIHNKELLINLDGWDVVRHSTESEIAEEKERRKFASVGREPGEIREGDIVINNDHGHPAIVTDIQKFIEHVDKYTIACFVDHREDVKTNE